MIRNVCPQYRGLIYLRRVFRKSHDTLLITDHYEFALLGTLGDDIKSRPPNESEGEMLKGYSNIFILKCVDIRWR